MRQKAKVLTVSTADVSGLDRLSTNSTIHDKGLGLWPVTPFNISAEVS